MARCIRAGEQPHVARVDGAHVPHSFCLWSADCVRLVDNVQFRLGQALKPEKEEDKIPQLGVADLFDSELWMMTVSKVMMIHN